MIVEIPLKLPSLNEYIKASKIHRGNWNKGNQLKQDIQKDIAVYLRKLPNYEKPVTINFTWVESNKKRDLDNICFAKKFILDALVNEGKLKNDNYKYVRGFMDHFEYGNETKVIIEVIENEL